MEIILKFYPIDEVICVVRTLRENLKRTQCIRKGVSQLLISFRNLISLYQLKLLVDG